MGSPSRSALRAPESSSSVSGKARASASTELTAWRICQRQSRGSYGYEYWRRLEKLDYEFMKRHDALATALRFTLSVPGVHTAIVGTARPGRFEENARHLEAGKLPATDMKVIRTRWSEVADRSWVGQT